MGSEQFGRLNMMAMLRALLDQGVGIFPNAGTPTSGTSGTYAGFAGPASLLLDYTNGVGYINTNTKASPTWDNIQAIIAGDISLAEGNVLIGNASALAAALDASAGGNILIGNDTTMVALDGSTDTQILVGNGTTMTSVAVSGDATLANTGALTIAANAVESSMLATSVLQVATGTISAAEIIGTSAGELGHADGYVMVPAAGALNVNQLVSCVCAMDFDTAAYTDGGNTTVNIGGGAALTGLVANTAFIQLGADGFIEWVPLAATINTYTLNNSLNLVTTVAPTDPGTAAGVIHFHCMYRTIVTGVA